MATPTSLPATFVAGNVLTAAQMNNLRGAFRILQVLQTVKTDTFTTTSTSYVDVTGVSQAITPSSASNKVLVMVNGVGGNSDPAETTRLTLVRDSTDIGVSTGGTSSNQTQFIHTSSGSAGVPFAIAFLDSPATTSATTYKLQIASTDATATACIGRRGSSANRGASTMITVMEVSA